MFCIFYIIVHVLPIVHIKLQPYLFPARIDDGCNVDNWHVHDYCTGSSIPLLANHWYKQAPGSDPKSNSRDFAGIRIDILNSARVLRFLIHDLACGGSHNLGYYAFIWDTILHGNAGEFGKS